ncbi:GTP 3',8-cyclase MoaA [Streptomyces solincola]|uniref:GTP 3',8-cyclase n=1 Tax=Streptomyces solincola TaxID=2100817 RepID=A0A2S9PNP3_9ACTN|nr:GTP 3',8-cyclase MoaA [Streptomyces solincola]PRH76035.1 GTP 3',8-cyclase MoaA [Streptomyces solincola]
MRPDAEPPPRDVFHRPLRDLRISVLDQCNLRCRYCMPEEHYTWLSKSDVLTLPELARLADVFIALGVAKIRLTGGEPLIRPDFPQIVGELAGRFGRGLRDLAVTTNGVLLAPLAQELKRAGLSRVTVSLDTLRAERFRALSRRNSHAAVIEGINALPAAGFKGTKINTVVVRDFNEDELADLIEFGRTVSAEVRFIEYMDVGGATGWNASKVVSRDEVLALLADHYGEAPRALDDERGAAPAERYALGDGTTFGLVSSTTQPFCDTCDRSRLTADGLLLTCLYSLDGLNLRQPLREGASDGELRRMVRDAWCARADRGAQERLLQSRRSAFVSLDSLRRDPHLEMHTRGG